MNNEIKTQADEKSLDTAAVENEAKENTADNKENKSTQEEFISEFAPEPIKIPKYNKEKEMAKVEKANAREKKRNTKKSKRRRRLLRKAVLFVRNTFLFILLFAVVATTLTSLLVKMNTSEYAVESAIRTHNPESFIVGKIKNPSKLNLKQSSPRAAVADVLRDNSMISVTYADIRQAVLKSSYPDFVADIAHDVLGFYIYGKSFDGVTREDISGAILENVSYIKLVTGIELGESACDDFGKYAVKSKTIKELSPKNLASQKAAGYTYITSVLFSTMTLTCLIIGLLLLLVLTVIACNGFAHKMIGWAAMLSGICVGVAGFVFKPMFKPSSEFVKCVADAIIKSFNQNSLIYGGIVVLVGLLVMLVGRAMNDDEDFEEYDEEDYIDEIEQVSVAQ